MGELLTLLGDLGRAKMSVHSLLSRPQWREHLLGKLYAAGLTPMPEGKTLDGHFTQWLLIFRRLGEHLLASPTGLPMRAVADALGMPLSSGTRFVDMLVQRGLLARHNDEQDRRVVMVTLTDLGQRLHGVVDTELQELIGGLLTHLSAEERHQLLHLGRKLYALCCAPATQGAQDPSGGTCQAV